MKNWPYKSALLSLPLLFTGCASNAFNKAATDVTLTGAGGVLGYKLSDGKPESTAIGAAAGYLVSKVAQSRYDKAVSEAEQAGYDRAMNQAVKQQYWIIQNQQKSLTIVGDCDPRLAPIVVPESNLNGVLTKAHVEYVRVSP